MKKLKKNMKKRGFTLIELLVVISIIGLLSSVVLASLTSAKQKAKNSAFVTSMLEFQKAVEVYKADKGHYPGADSTTDTISSCVNTTNDNVSCPTYNPNIIAGMQSEFAGTDSSIGDFNKYISKIPSGVNRASDFSDTNDYDAVAYGGALVLGNGLPITCGNQTLTPNNSVYSIMISSPEILSLPAMQIYGASSDDPAVPIYFYCLTSLQ